MMSFSRSGGYFVSQQGHITGNSQGALYLEAVRDNAPAQGANKKPSRGI